MTAMQFLDSLDQATGAVQAAAGAARARGGAEAVQAATNLATNLALTERRAQEDMSRAASIPLPAPDASAAGGWSAAVRRNARFMGLAGQLAGPVWGQAVIGRLVTDAARLHSWATGSPAPAAQPIIAQPVAAPQAMAFAGPVAPVAAAAASGPIFTPRVVGGIMMLLTTGTGILATYLNAREERKRAAPFDEPEPKKRRNHDPAEVMEAAQQVLDQDLPGATASVRQSPDGDWMASVRRGTKVVARRRGKSAAEAAGEAVRAAIDTTIRADGDVIDAEFVELAPKSEAKQEVAAG